MTSEATMRPGTVSTKGSDASTSARPTSHITMRRLRSKRAANTPAAGPRKKPGKMRADMTRPTAATGRSLIRVASAAMARKTARKSAAQGKRVAVAVEMGGGGSIRKKKKQKKK